MRVGAFAVALTTLGSCGTAHAFQLPSRIAGGYGLRPMIGATGDLGVDVRTLIGGSKVVFGVDFHLGDGRGGVSFVPGLHLAIGDRAFVMQPLFDVQYRFDTRTPVVPWIGGGVSLKLGFGRDQDANIGLTFRVSGGVEFFLAEWFGIGLQLTLPDIGPRFTPFLAAVGTVEITAGPHFRF